MWNRSRPLVFLRTNPRRLSLALPLGRSVLAFETLPRIQLQQGRLLVEHPHAMNHFVPVEQVIYHAIFERTPIPGRSGPLGAVPASPRPEE